MTSPTPDHWQIQDAKQRFSEMIRAVTSEGPQVITRHGEDVAVVVDIGEWHRLTRPAVDLAGILLGGKHNRLTTRRSPAVVIPWADVEQIILYSSEPGDQAPVQRIGIQRREGAAESREITGWRLDRDRLAAVTAMMAPDVRIVEAVTNTRPGIEGPVQAALASSTDPRIQETGSATI